MGCVLVCNHFPNGDGLLGIMNSKDPDGFSAQRLLHTDSGHYLLPVDNFKQAKDKRLTTALRGHTGKLQSAARKQGLAQDTLSQLHILNQ